MELSDRATAGEPFLLTTDVLDLPASLHQAWAVLAALSTAWLAHEAVRRRASPGRVVLLSIVAGASFVFFDLLTIPPGAWALTVVVVLLAAGRHVGGTRLGALGALAASGWFAGYASMWVAKWAFAVPVYGYDRVRTVIVDTTTFRLDGQPGYRIDLSLDAGIRRTWDVWTTHPLAWPVLVALPATVVVVIVARRRRGTLDLTHRLTDRLVIAAPALLPPLWFEVVRNHTQIHAFPARSVPIALGIAAVAIVVRLSENRGCSATGPHGSGLWATAPRA